MYLPLKRLNLFNIILASAEQPSRKFDFFWGVRGVRKSSLGTFTFDHRQDVQLSGECLNSDYTCLTLTPASDLLFFLGFSLFNSLFENVCTASMEAQKSGVGICSNSCSAGIKHYFCIMSVASGCMTAEPTFFYACLHVQGGKKKGWRADS